MSATSNVVPFPKPFAPRPDDRRLAAALAGLVSALDEQLRQLRRFRAAAGRLAAETAALKESMGSYRRRLDGLASGVGALHGQSRRLAATMEMSVPPAREY
jgi:hypothetical protein